MRQAGWVRTASRDVIALALPATAALAADPLLGLVDTAIVGRLGTAELAALGIDTAVFSTLFVALNFLTYGTTAEVARLVGGGRRAEAARHAVQALWLAVAGGVVITLVLLLATGPVVRLMGAAGGVVDPAVAYLRVRALAAVPVLVVQVGHGAFRGIKDTRTPLVVTVVANVVNALLSWWLVHPMGFGVAGAAWGTVAAQAGAAAAFLALGRGRLRPDRLTVDPRAMRAITTISRDLFLRTLALVGGLAVVTAVAARVSATTVAAHQIVREVWMLATLALDGFAIAGQALVGQALGAGDVDRARAEARALLGWGAGAGLVAAVALAGAAGPLPAVFTADEAVRSAARDVWWLVVLLQPVGGVVFVLDGVFMGAGDFGYLLRTTAASVVLGLLPVALLVAPAGWGLAGLWWAMLAMVVLRGAALVWRLRSPDWAATALARNATSGA